MKYKIHFTLADGSEDVIILEGETIEEIQIKAEVKEIGFTVKGTTYMAVYGEARKTWIPKRLDRYVDTHPDIKDCFTVGEANVSLRKI